MNRVTDWWRRRQRNKQNARWFADVLAGTHVHGEECTGYLIPRCMQVELLNNGRALISLKQPLSANQAGNLRAAWKAVYPAPEVVS